jgi:hypothetical protein
MENVAIIMKDSPVGCPRQHAVIIVSKIALPTVKA